MPRPAKRPAKPAAKKSATSKSSKAENLDWKVLNDRGSDRTIAGKLDKAIEDFDAAIALAPKEALPKYNRGTARLLGGDIVGSIEDFTAAIELDAEFVPAYERRGVAKQNLDDFDGALADFDAALRIMPDNPDTLAERATVRAQRDDYEGAVQDLERALVVAPQDWEMRDEAEGMLRAMRKAKESHAGHEHAATLAPHAHPDENVAKEPATSIVERALEEAGWPFSRVDDGQGEIDYLTQMDAGEMLEAVVVRLSERLERLVLYVLFRPKAKKEHRMELCEFVARANFGMGDGNFEMSFDDGSARFKVALDFTGISLPTLLVRNMIVDAMSTIEVYEAALVRVIAGKAKAKAALRVAERAAVQQGSLQ